MNSSFRPYVEPCKQPGPGPHARFTPMQGFLSIGRLLAERVGLGGMWAGDEGLEAVARQKLSELGVPEKAIALKGAGMTPRQMAESSGFIKRRRPHRRVK